MVSTPCLQWCPTTMTSKKPALNDVILSCRSAWLGTTSSKLRRTQTVNFGAKQRSTSESPIRRACSGGFDDHLSDDEFSRKINKLAHRFHISDDECHKAQFPAIMDDRWLEIEQELSDWSTAARMEMKANSVDIPVSIRIIKQKKKKKQQWRGEGSIEVSEIGYCSVRKAFSSMVFIIQELHSYILQLREVLFFEDLQGILGRVQKEMQASFVWLFQQVFSDTPILMVHVMILLANFTVHSMSISTAIAALPPSIVVVEAIESGDTTETVNKIDASSVESTFFGRGGSKTKPVASGTDGDRWGGNESQLTTRQEESVSGYHGMGEMGLWNSIEEEASRMQVEVRGGALDHETVQRFVSPVTVKVTGDKDYEDYFRTELVYQTGLDLEPNSSLLLTNYAQFLYLVARDYDRAEEYFKKAVAVEPKDAEAHNKYAIFLWQARNNLWAAEETFLEAISTEPSNSFYAANYAHFLWNTGGEDTCFPLAPNDETPS